MGSPVKMRYYDLRKRRWGLPPAVLIKAGVYYGFRDWMDGAEVLGFYWQQFFYGGWLLCRTKKRRYFRVYYTPRAWREKRYLEQVGDRKWILRVPQLIKEVFA